MTSDGPGKNNIGKGTGSVLVLRYSEWSRLLNCPATESQGVQLQLKLHSIDLFILYVLRILRCSL